MGPKQPTGAKNLHLFFTFALCPTGLGSSHFVVRMVASLCIIWGTFPVCRISTSVDFPCRGGPMTIIFISLHFSALRSCARKYASTVLGPAGWEANRFYLCLAIPNVHTYSRLHKTYCRRHISWINIFPAVSLWAEKTQRINKETSSGQTWDRDPRKRSLLRESTMEHCKKKQMLWLVRFRSSKET